MSDISEIKNKLKLIGFNGIYDYLNSNIEINKLELNNINALEKFINIELEHKKATSLNYKLKNARFPIIKNIEETSQKQLIEHIDIKQFISEHYNIIFYGGTGTGKTHLSIGFGYKLIQLNYKVIYYTLNDLINIIIKQKQYNKLNTFLKKMFNFDLIIIDEFGYMPVNEEASSALYELFNNMYEKKSLIVSTYLKFEDWVNIFKNEKSTKVIVDRLTHYCHVIQTGNISFRKS